MTEATALGLCSTRRSQSLIDVFVSVFLGMLIWPFPIARAMLSPGVHVAGVVATCAVMQVAYFSVCSAAWGQTLGMRLMGLRLDSGTAVETRSRAAVWGAATGTLALWYALAPQSACGASFPERLSGVGAETTGIAEKIRDESVL